MKLFPDLLLILLTPFAIYGIMCAMIKLAEHRIKIYDQFKPKKSQDKKGKENKNG